MNKALLVAIAISVVGLAPAFAQSAAPVKVGQTSAGPVLTDEKGMTLYTYTRDMPGHSNCNDVCAAAWPPLMADANAQSADEWTVITRDDGKKQWAQKDSALYRWSKDAKPGDTLGEGLDKGKWHVAKP